MQIGDLVKFAGYLRDVSPKGSTPKIGMIVGIDDQVSGPKPRIEVLWQSGDLKKMRGELFEVIHDS
jgi:hypothetical protein|tara:strand:+ start:1309 stop:1506 length:198 start_codon:yes stop_codon:yes gene_type:complete